MENHKKRRFPKLPKITVVGEASAKGQVAADIRKLHAGGGRPITKDEVDSFRRKANIKQQSSVKIVETNVSKKIVWRYEGKRGDFDRNPHEIELIRSEQAYQIELNKVRATQRQELYRRMQASSKNTAKVLELADKYADKGRGLVSLLVKKTNLSESTIRRILKNRKFNPKADK